MTNIIQSEDN